MRKKPSSRAVDMWQLDSKTERSFAVTRPRQLGELSYNAVTIAVILFLNHPDSVKTAFKNMLDAVVSSFHEKATVVLLVERILSAKELTVFQVFRLAFYFFSCKSAASSSQTGGYHYRKVSNPKTQERDVGAG